MFALRLADGAVVDVGEIADVLHLVRAELELQQPPQHILDEERAEIADVRGGINGRPAAIHAENAAGLRRFEFAELPGQGIVESEGHVGKGI